MQPPKRQPEPRLIPFVIEKTGRGSPREAAVFHRLLKERVIFVGTAIDDTIANLIMAQLLFLQHEDPRAEIRVVFESPGGSMTASFAIYDTMRFVKNPVATYGIGAVQGSAALLLCAGTRGRRFALPTARITFTEIWGGPTGSEAERLEQQSGIDRLTTHLHDAFALHTQKPIALIAKAHAALATFAPEDAKQFGLIDEVIAALPFADPKALLDEARSPEPGAK